MVLFSDDDKEVDIEKLANELGDATYDIEKEFTESVEASEESLITVDSVINAREAKRVVETPEVSVPSAETPVNVAEAPNEDILSEEHLANLSSDVASLMAKIPKDKYDVLGDELTEMERELKEIEESLYEKPLEEPEITIPEFKPITKPVNFMPVEPVAPMPYISKADLSDEQFDAIMEKLSKVTAMEREIDAMKQLLEDNLAIDFKAMYENLMQKNNIEAIKTYRNIQAVIVEENAKQNRALFGIDGKSDNLKKRLNKVIIFSIISFVVSILVMIVQILPAFGIDLGLF